MRQAKHFPLAIDLPDPARTLYFPNLPGRGGAPDAVLDYGDHEGYKRLDDNDPRAVYWRGFVGTFIAEHLGLDIDKAWHISTWPEGYALWVKERNSSKPQIDSYLFGFGGRKRFRTPREFAFHAVWLYDDNYFAAGDEACQCTLHTGRPQEMINEEWIYGHERRRSSNSHGAAGRDQTPQAGGGDGGAERGIREGGIEGGSDDEHSPIVQPFIHWSRSKKYLLEATGGPTLNPQWRPPLLAAAIQNHQAPWATPSRHRPLELVWVSVDPLDSWIRGEETIRWWPALVHSKVPGQPPQTSKVALLGVNTHYIVNETRIHAWKTQPLPHNFLQRPLPWLGGQRMRSAEALNRFRPLPDCLDPLPDPFPRQYDLAILPYSIALRQAARIETQYNPFELVQQADGSFGYHGLYYGPERIQLGDLVRLRPNRQGFESRGLARRWLPASIGANSRPLFGLILHVGENERDGDLRFKARIFELQPFRGSNHPNGNDNLPDAPDGFRFREVTTSMSPAPNLPIEDIACRYDQDDAVLAPSSGGVEVTGPDATPGGIQATNWYRSREEGIRGAHSEALEFFYGAN
ncbi:hypothetical protein M407DRAFT_128910 [Tulasnella calospora MUT 4182]|uniref:Cryptic loci regulator 2 N-terminal domain-containing protein n=1 Tax=Tulasnella calospora MUT 4182 TaxID=1051891 RepID=A0A0C3QTN8_9AGAM|nr:hypothetical protein M407DRAFT_128910 [Tulasnella calospora MUT 4182]